MTVPGLVLDVVGKDATLLANGAVKTSMQTETISIGPGESFDCLFTAPAVTASRPRTCSTTAPTRRRRTATSRASAACARKSASTRRARCPPRPRPTRKDTSMRPLTFPLASSRKLLLLSRRRLSPPERSS